MNTARPGLGVRHGDDHAIDEPDGVVFDFQTRARLRETSQEAHGTMVDRLRYATRQGHAASPTRLVDEIRELNQAIRSTHGVHGPAHSASLERVRVCYLELAVTCLILAERVTRPPVLKRGAKSSTEKWRAPKFKVPAS